MASSRTAAIRKAKARSRITNGRSLLPRGADGRSLFARRLRDLIAMHISDLGGADACSESEKAIVRRAATIIVQLEQMEMQMAIDANAVTATHLDLYQRLANTLRRLLECLGLKRRTKDVKDIDLASYIRRRANAGTTTAEYEGER